jgi:hypothetical protein
MLAVAWPSWRWTALMLAPWRTEEERAAPPLYAHKVTVDRAYGGHGLGAELLDWAGTRAADEGSDWLRVDVWTTNERLPDYLRQGFTCVRTVVLPHNPAGALFQRPAQPRPPWSPAGSTGDATGRDVGEACSRSAPSFPIDRVTPRLDTM